MATASTKPSLSPSTISTTIALDDVNLTNSPGLRGRGLVQRWVEYRI
jgi:hypothetical protein